LPAGDLGVAERAGEILIAAGAGEQLEGEAFAIESGWRPHRAAIGE
jgi:hypothetical protein